MSIRNPRGKSFETASTRELREMMRRERMIINAWIVGGTIAACGLMSLGLSLIRP